MIINSFQIKRYLLIPCVIIVCCAHIYAQENPIESYLKQAGDYAEIYTGRIETEYSRAQYENFPYYLSNNDFSEAAIVYKNKYYPNLRARLDLFKEQLIILPYEKRLGVVVDSQNIDRVYMYDKTFIWLNLPKESGIKTGFYLQLFNSEKIQLFSKNIFNLLHRHHTIFYFDRKTRYYLFFANRYHNVNNKNSFSKLFPQYKKQINQFSKDHKLNFKNNAEESLTSLAGYCEELIKSTNK